MCVLCQLPLTHETERLIITRYLDPGSGQAIQSVVPMLIAFLSGLIASSLFFFRKIIKFFFRKRIFFAVLAVVVIGIIIILMFTNLQSNQSNNNVTSRIIVVAFDGLDPEILNEGMKKNLLPNFKKIAQDGFYSKLTTTMPPQSPVAWASFITGTDPSKHGIYDFITRNPENYELDLSFSKNSSWKTNPFWKVLSENNIPSTILFLPNTYPPAKFNGKLLSGMGTPDLLGTLGTLSLITTKDYSAQDNFRGKIIKISNNDSISTQIEGPKYNAINETKTSTIPIQVKKNIKDQTVRITVQGKNISLSKNEFSDWIKVTFDIDFFTKAHGILKFYIKEISPDIEIYVSPINFDPENPLHPISTPNSYAKEIAKEYGPYSTLGLPHDTWALDQEIFDEEAFLAQSESIINIREKIYLGELKKFEKGFFFGYFGMTDSISHMFFRFLNDPDSKYQNTIIETYQAADGIVGKTLNLMEKNDTLIILSDHGFKSFDYEINLNSWLLENGYLVLNNDKKEGRELLEDVDWSRTKAYAIGYNGIYFNIKNRENSGIVEQKNTEILEMEISEKLKKFENPFNGKLVVKKVYSKSELGISGSDKNTPDLHIGFYKGIRSSWFSAVGGISGKIITKRTSKWSGDHLFDPSEVPGILLINKKTDVKKVNITDVIPTIFKILNIQVPENLDGKSII